MKKFFNKLFLSKSSMTIFTALAALAVLFDYSERYSFVFVDNTVFKGFSMAIFILMIANSALLFILSSMRMRNADVYYKKSFRAIYLISVAYSIFSILFSVITLITGGSQNLQLTFLMCKEIFPIWIAAVTILYVFLILPFMFNQKRKRFAGIVISVGLAFAVYASLFPISPYKLTSGPAVFDNGKSYSVVFSTNDKGTGYIEYEFGGESVKLFDQSNGRKNGDSIIHTIKVPYEQLNGNSYKIGSTRVIDELSYGGRSGKTVESHEYSFGGNFSDDINLLSVSDWHTYMSLAKSSISHLGNYDAVLLLGDGAPGLMFEEEAATNIIEFASDLTNGTMPIIFTRGNHETRGKAAAQLADYLGFDEFYFKASLGDYNFIVLDSGEDKEDSHPEYGGMVAYEQSRKDMVSWLETLENTTGSKTIALSHSDEICIEEDLALRAKQKLSELNTSILLSGHQHKTEYKADGVYPVLVDGGINANGKGTFVASMVSLSQNGINIKSVDNTGKVVLTETAEWK